MPLLPTKRKVEQIDWSASTLVSRDLPKTVYRNRKLDLSLTHTNRAASATLLEVMEMVSKLELVINGQDNIQVAPLFHLYYQNLFDFSQTPVSNVADHTAGSGTSYVSLIMPQMIARGARKNDTVLDARKLSSLVLNANWGAASGLTDATVTAGYLGIDTDEYANVPEAFQLGRHEFAYESRNLDSVGDIQIKLDTGGRNIYYRVWIYTFNSSDVLANSLITNIELGTRNVPIININADRLQFDNMMKYSISRQTGVYCLDLTTDGRMSECLNAVNLSDVILSLTSTVSDGSVKIVYEKVILG